MSSILLQKKMKFFNLKITLSIIIFIVTIISLYYLILDMDSIVYAEQIDQQIIQNDQSSDAEEELKKREEKDDVMFIIVFHTLLFVCAVTLVCLGYSYRP